MPEVLITVGIVVAALLIILIAIFSTWKKVPADKAAIVTGIRPRKGHHRRRHYGHSGPTANRLCDIGKHQL